MSCCDHPRGVYCDVGQALRTVQRDAFDKKAAYARIDPDGNPELEAAWQDAKTRFYAHLLGDTQPEAGMSLDLTKLREPFSATAIEWRIAQAGQKDGKVWAKCVVYITGRAIMDRLDDVCGPGDWQVEYREGVGHLHAGIGIKREDEWVWKWDGTGLLATTKGLSGTDAGKGDFSNALKPAALAWGIARDLRNVGELWAIVNDSGRFYAAKSDKAPAFHWDPPRLPDSATPNGQNPIIAEMERLWLDAQGVGVGADDEKDEAGMNAVEIAISTGNVAALRKAKTWLTGAIKDAKGEAVPA